MTSWKEWRLPHCPGVNLERFVGTTGFWWFSAVIKSYSISFDNGTFGITPVNSDQNLLLWKTRWGLLQLKWYVFQKRVAGVQDANLVTQQQRDILRSAVLFVWRELIARIIVGLRPFSLSLILRPRYFLDGNFNHHPILIASNNQANEAVLTFQNIGLKDVNRSFTCSCVLNKPPAAWMLFLQNPGGLWISPSGASCVFLGASWICCRSRSYWRVVRVRSWSRQVVMRKAPVGGWTLNNAFSPFIAEKFE